MQTTDNTKRRGEERREEERRGEEKRRGEKRSGEERREEERRGEEDDDNGRKRPDFTGTQATPKKFVSKIQLMSVLLLIGRQGAAAADVCSGRVRTRGASACVHVPLFLVGFL